MKKFNQAINHLMAAVVLRSSNYLLGPGKCAGAVRFYFSANAVGRLQMVMVI